MPFHLTLSQAKEKSDKHEASRDSVALPDERAWLNVLAVVMMGSFDERQSSRDLGRSRYHVLRRMVVTCKFLQ